MAAGIGWYETRALSNANFLPKIGGIPQRFEIPNSILRTDIRGNGPYSEVKPQGKATARSSYQQEMDSRYGANSNTVSYFDRQRDYFDGGYDKNAQSFGIMNNGDSGEWQPGIRSNSVPGIQQKSSLWRFGQKMDESGNLSEWRGAGSELIRSRVTHAGGKDVGWMERNIIGFGAQTQKLKALSMPSSGETIDNAINALWLKRSDTGAWANQQDKYAFEDLTALKTSGNIYAPSTQFQIKKQSNANNAMAADIKSQSERSVLQAKIRSNASEEASKRKTSFRNTTINMARNGLKIPNSTGS